MEVQLKAREMFEKLGYEVFETPYNNCLCYRTQNNYYNLEVEFWLDDKICYHNLIYGDYQMKGSSPLTKDLLQAINKQIEELGWK